MDSASIAGLLRPFATLSNEQLSRTSTYIDLLLKWNAKVNLTAVRRPEEIVTRHFGESFFAATQLLAVSRPETVIDVGSGAGFPGLPLAMFAPAAQVTLIEANGRKAAFLNEAIAALELKNAKVVSQRAETYPGIANLVTMRAVEKFEKALPLALRLVGEGGRIALMIGSSQLATARALAGGVSWNEPLPVPGGHSRVLAVGTKLVNVG
ncbi:MAG TPA: 16S rRNA (guanine(527)-N(7))-methyltransferase RsmG [Candidatus Angelobacter sp.]